MVTWDDDSPTGRRDASISLIFATLVDASIILITLHIIHFIFIIFYSRFNKSASTFPDFLRKCLKACMILNYLFLILCTVGIIWSFTTFNTEYRVSVFLFFLALAWVTIFVGIFYSFIFVPFLWKKEFLQNPKISIQNIFVQSDSSLNLPKGKKCLLFSFIIAVCVSIFFVASYGICVPHEPIKDISTTLSRIITTAMGYVSKINVKQKFYVSNLYF